MARLRRSEPAPVVEPVDDDQDVDEHERWHREGMRRQAAQLADWRAELASTSNPKVAAQLARTERYLERVRARAAGRRLPRRDPRLPSDPAA